MTATDDMTAADITLGQRWRHVVTHARERGVFEIVDIRGDKVNLVPLVPGVGVRHWTNFGSLLAYYELAE